MSTRPFKTPASTLVAAKTKTRKPHKTKLPAAA